jgi:hypothetical protein
MLRFVVLLLMASACSLSRGEAVEALKSPDAAMRAQGARSLRGFVDVAPPLLEAVRAESDHDAKREMVAALGPTGADDAKPIIETYVIEAHGAADRWAAGRSLIAWLAARGLLDKDAYLPAGWPYGQPGYPPKE